MDLRLCFHVMGGQGGVWMILREVGQLLFHVVISVLNLQSFSYVRQQDSHLFKKLFGPVSNGLFSEQGVSSFPVGFLDLDVVKEVL